MLRLAHAPPPCRTCQEGSNAASTLSLNARVSLPRTRFLSAQVSIIARCLTTIWPFLCVRDSNCAEQRSLPQRPLLAAGAGRNDTSGERTAGLSGCNLDRLSRRDTTDSHPSTLRWRATRRRLPQEIRQREMRVQSAAGVAQVLGDDRLQAEAFDQLADQNQAGV
jgi:hypothetical protein